LQTENQRCALRRDLVAESLGQLHQETRADTAHVAEPIVGESGAQILLQLIHESPLIAPFKRDFVVSADQVSHLVKSLAVAIRFKLA